MCVPSRTLGFRCSVAEQLNINWRVIPVTGSHLTLHKIFSGTSTSLHISTRMCVCLYRVRTQDLVMKIVMSFVGRYVFAAAV